LAENVERMRKINVTQFWLERLKTRDNREA